MSFSNVETFFIEGNAETLTAEEIAKEIGATPRAVKAYIRKMPPKPKEPEPPKTAFKIQNGSVSMTAAEAAKKAVGGVRNPKTLKGVRLLDPDKPCH